MRFVRGFAVVACGVLMLLAGCTSGAPTVAPGTSSPVPKAAAAPVSRHCDPADLMSCLISPPVGARQPSASSAQVVPSGPMTVDQFLHTFYPDDATTGGNLVRDQLAAQGLQSIAHQIWIQGADEVDVVLLRFAGATGAASRADAVSAALAADKQWAALTLPGLTSPGVLRLFRNVAPDKDGTLSAWVIGRYGSVELELHFYSPATLDTATLTAWLKAQDALLSGLS